MYPFAAYNTRFLFYSLTDWNSVLNTMTAMTAFLENYVTGAQAELFFCRYVEDIRCFFLYHMVVFVQKAVQEAWTNHFIPALVTVADGMTITVWTLLTLRVFSWLCLVTGFLARSASLVTTLCCLSAIDSLYSGLSDSRFGPIYSRQTTT